MTRLLGSLLYLGGDGDDSSSLTMASLGVQRKALLVLDVHNMAVAKSRMEGKVSVSIGAREAYVLQVLSCKVALHYCTFDN